MLTAEYDRLKNDYREIFLKTAGEVRAEVESVRPEGFVGDIFKHIKLGLRVLSGNKRCYLCSI